MNTLNAPSQNAFLYKFTSTRIPPPSKPAAAGLLGPSHNASPHKKHCPPTHCCGRRSSNASDREYISLAIGTCSSLGCQAARSQGAGSDCPPARNKENTLLSGTVRLHMATQGEKMMCAHVCGGHRGQDSTGCLQGGGTWLMVETAVQWHARK